MGKLQWELFQDLSRRDVLWIFPASHKWAKRLIIPVMSPSPVIALEYSCSAHNSSPVSVSCNNTGVQFLQASPSAWDVTEISWRAAL